MSREVLTYYQSSAIYRAAGKYGGYILLFGADKNMGTYVDGGGDVGHNNPLDMTYVREVNPDWKKDEINGLLDAATVNTLLDADAVNALVTPELPPIPDTDGDYFLQRSVSDGDAVDTWEDVPE